MDLLLIARGLAESRTKAQALANFAIDVTGCTCADVGSSTGGFTDCLLQQGAVKVYAIDVGKGILHWKVRSDPRLVVMEETNARHVVILPEPDSLAIIALSGPIIKLDLRNIFQQVFIWKIWCNFQAG
ncbi:MAG TPA: SAM-dependent methyltransferase [Anaerolineales bacterium]